MECVYYYQDGAWRAAKPITSGPCASTGDARTLRGLRIEIERMGYPAVAGDTRIGPPEGPPRDR